MAFLRQTVRAAQRRSCRARLAEEVAAAAAAAGAATGGVQAAAVRVEPGSTIRVQSNIYSVASRLIGEWVEARLYAERVEVWYAQKQVEQLPRLRGRGKHRIDYRHVIDWLVRKPGAFADYRYRADLFPSSRFRMAYDVLRQQQPERAAKEYLRILHLAASESEAASRRRWRGCWTSEWPLSVRRWRRSCVSNEADPSADRGDGGGGGPGVV